MPELPEVNTLSAALNKRLQGDSFKVWQKLSPKLRLPLPDGKLVAKLLGRPIEAVKRVAKSIYFAFGLEEHLHVHLGMTGGFILDEHGGARLPHEHVRIELGSGQFLHYCDSRRFGVVELAKVPHQPACEPFAGSLTWQYLAEICQRSNRSIKALIMDQSVIGGLGNIYATEALLESGILPFREAASLSAAEIKKLCSASIRVIDRAVKSGLKSLKPDYRIDVNTTHFAIVTHVYGREGQVCGWCGVGQIMRVVIAGRSSCYCPLCQH